MLGRDRVGTGDSFLDLGGDSLLATRVQARLRAETGLVLPPSAVLAGPRPWPPWRRRWNRPWPTRRRPRPRCPPILPRPRDERGEPISLAQRRLWFLERLVPGTSASNIPVVMRLDGPLAPAALEAALVAIAARHEALRTAIGIGPEGEPLQTVAPPAPFRLPLADLSGLPPLQRAEERGRLEWEEARRPFDPDREPSGAASSCAWRSASTICSSPSTTSSLTASRSRCWSASWRALYNALMAGRDPALAGLAPLTVQDGRRHRLGARDPDPRGPGAAPRLLTGASGRGAVRSRPAGRSAAFAAAQLRGVSRPLALSPALSREVREFARRRGATMYMALLAAWVAFLRRVTGQDDVVFGTVLAHRGRPELDGLIGFFANSLPLRFEQPGDPGFGDLLAAARAASLGPPGPPGSAARSPGRDPAAGKGAFRSPVQAFFALHANAGRREIAPGLSLTWREVDHGASQIDLLLDLEDGGETVTGRLVASADLFTAATVERLAQGWVSLLADAVARPAVPVSTLALLGAAERHVLLAEWGRAPQPPAWDRSVPARVLAWAAAAPGAVAVLPAEPGRPALTYGELGARAHQLAGRLRERGVGPDVRVGIYAERSPETLIGMLAVLVAGGRLPAARSGLSTGAAGLDTRRRPCAGAPRPARPDRKPADRGRRAGAARSLRR